MAERENYFEAPENPVRASDAEQKFLLISITMEKGGFLTQGKLYGNRTVESNILFSFVRLFVW